jgi:hypothetical protein
MATRSTVIAQLPSGLSWPAFGSAYKNIVGSTTKEQISAAWTEYKTKGLAKPNSKQPHPPTNPPPKIPPKIPPKPVLPNKPLPKPPAGPKNVEGLYPPPPPMRSAPKQPRQKAVAQEVSNKIIAQEEEKSRRAQEEDTYKHYAQHERIKYAPRIKTFPTGTFDIGKQPASNTTKGLLEYDVTPLIYASATNKLLEDEELHEDELEIIVGILARISVTGASITNIVYDGDIRVFAKVSPDVDPNKIRNAIQCNLPEDIVGTKKRIVFTQRA